jgi:sugar phosphate isomerase/epimerase
MRSIAINKICLPELSYEQAVDAIAKAGFQGITPWIDDVKHLTPAEARRVALNAGIEISGFCNCGLFALEGRDRRSASIDQAKRNIDYAAEIGATSIVTVVGGLLPHSTDLADAKKFAFDCMVEVHDHAKNTPVTLAIEALHPMYTPDWSVVTSLKTANDWCDRLGPGAGLTVDTYHTWWDPDWSEELERAKRSNRLATYHVSDWLVPTNHLLLDRGMPGEGVIDLESFDTTMKDLGYNGTVEIEIFSERLWALQPIQFLAELKQRCNRLYGK